MPRKNAVQDPLFFLEHFVSGGDSGRVLGFGALSGLGCQGKTTGFQRPVKNGFPGDLEKDSQIRDQG